MRSGKAYMLPCGCGFNAASVLCGVGLGCDGRHPAPNTSAMRIQDALVAGRQAADILEALPLDETLGYSPDEEAAQFAAVDRLVAAFRSLDREGAK